MSNHAYYNENDPFAAAWLRNLIKEGLIADGEVDERSIKDVSAVDLLGFSQCHFFAGIGGWSYALRLAGWPDDRSVWTGSCPCQPFSAAGKRQGFADDRHLWPFWFRLIAEFKPPIVFGEQVASATVWLDGVYADMEAANYAVGAAILPACGVDAPHRRDRLWFVANAERGDGDGRSNITQRNPEGGAVDRRFGADALADATSAGSLPSASTRVYRGEASPRPRHVELERQSDGVMADANSGHGFWWSGPLQVGWNAIEGKITAGGDFSGTQWRIKPGLPLLAHGVPNRVGLLRGFGNAIVSELAAQFIAAADEALA